MLSEGKVAVNICATSVFGDTLVLATGRKGPAAAGVGGVWRERKLLIPARQKPPGKEAGMSRERVTRSLIAALPFIIGFTAVAAGAPAEPPPPVFSSGVELITVDA